MIRAVIVDDEAKAIQSLTWEVSNFKEDISIVSSFSNPKEALIYLKKAPLLLYVCFPLLFCSSFLFFLPLLSRFSIRSKKDLGLRRKWLQQPYSFSPPARDSSLERSSPWTVGNVFLTP